MKIGAASFLPLAVRLGEYLVSAADRVAALRAAGIEVTPDLLAVWLTSRMETWNPVVAGRVLFDAETRLAAARFVAGVGFNLAGRD